MTKQALKVYLKNTNGAVLNALYNSLELTSEEIRLMDMIYRKRYPQIKVALELHQSETVITKNHNRILTNLISAIDNRKSLSEENQTLIRRIFNL